jgi:hypothetical protein
MRVYSIIFRNLFRMKISGANNVESEAIGIKYFSFHGKECKIIGCICLMIYFLFLIITSIKISKCSQKKLSVHKIRSEMKKKNTIRVSSDYKTEKKKRRQPRNVDERRQILIIILITRC